MADTKISALAQNTGVATNDRVPHVDVSDTSMAASGTTKYATVSDLLTGVYIAGGTDVAVTDGGTGASTASAARTNLGVAYDTDVYHPGGTDVAVADGGTGSSTASAARTALGLAIGTNVQAWDADLDALATASAAANVFPYFTSTSAATTTPFVPWTAYTPTADGWNNGQTGPLNANYRYMQIGKTVIIAIGMTTNGTSNATTKTVSLPQAGGPGTAATVTNMTWIGQAQYFDNNAAGTLVGCATVSSAGTAIAFGTTYSSASTSSWTATGNCRISKATVIYECA